MCSTKKSTYSLGVVKAFELLLLEIGGLVHVQARVHLNIAYVHTRVHLNIVHVHIRVHLNIVNVQTRV